MFLLDSNILIYYLKFPDAVIAATAITHKLTLVSRDEVFKKVRALKLENPSFGRNDATV